MAVINGTPGNDSKFGTNGSDFIDVLDGNDFVNARGGNDLVLGGANNDTLLGDFGSDVVDGGTGNDNLEGGFGVDVLTGGAGADNFTYRDDDLGLDVITDFVVADDTIRVAVGDFGGGIGVGALEASEFRIGSAAADATDRFIYNNTTGDLTFDKDGTGAVAPVRIATLSANLALTNNDIVGAVI